MAFELFTRVALREDFSNHKLRQGDVATIVERLLSSGNGVLLLCDPSS